MKMLTLPPPPPPPPPPPLSPSTPPKLPPPPRNQGTPVSLKQVVISRPYANQQSPATETGTPYIKRPCKPPVFQHPRPRRTNILIWCCATLCLIFSLILIFVGVAILIIFLVIRPRAPAFDIPNATLNTIYFDSPEYFNGDFTFLVNISNPNRKIGVRFEFSEIELYFFNKLISTQVVQPFIQQPRERRLESVHMISSLVLMPLGHAVELQKQVRSNRIKYNIRANFKVKANLGVIHFSYWLHSRCQLEMTGPPTGVLVSHSCRTKR